MPNRNLRRRGLALAAFGCVFFAAVTAFTAPQATGYEVSMYDVYPWYFWGAIVLSIGLGSFLLFAEALRPSEGQGHWQAGFLAIVLSQAVLVLLPTIRGYAIYGRADAVTHIGFMRTIRDSGTFGPRNIYPALHDLGLTFSYATGLSLDAVVTTLPPLLTLFSLLALYVLLDVCFDRRRKLVLLPFATLLVFSTGHLNFAPYAMSLLFIPFVLYLFFKYRAVDAPAVFSLFIVAIVAIVVYHPLTTIFLVALLAATYPFERSFALSGASFNVAAVASIVFGIWYFGFVGILRMISTTIANLALGSGDSDLEQYSQVISRTTPQLSDLVQVAVLKYGIFLIASVFAGLFALTLLSRYLKRGDRPAFESLFFLVAYVVFGVVSTVFLFTAVVGGFNRPLALAKLFAVIVAGLYAAMVLSEEPDAGPLRVPSGVIAVVLVGMIVISTFGVFPSPLMKEQSWQTTQMELEGMDWTITNVGDEAPLLHIGLNPNRYYDRVVGVRGFQSMNTVGPPVDHFGYHTGFTLGANYPGNSSRHLLITEHGRDIYPRVFPNYREQWRFTPGEFRRLERDPTVDHLYDNGEFDAYHVRGTNETSEAT